MRKNDNMLLGQFFEALMITTTKDKYESHLENITRKYTEQIELRYFM